MTRRNPEVERLEALLDTMRRAEAERRKPPGDLPVAGCGDSSCEVSPPGGQGTNGGCRCDARTLRFALRWQKRRTAFLEETIREMREAEQQAEVERFTAELRRAEERAR